jgi:hypothetical protein
MDQPDSFSGRRWWALLTSEWMIVTLILGVAIFFRFYQLPMIPAEFEFDEWAESADALDMMANGLRIFSTLNNGRELLFAYLVMAGFYLFGPQDIVLRGIGALAGTLTVGAAYLLTRELFSQVAPRQARWIATLTSLGLAVSFWQVIHIRMGRRHTLLPLFLAVGFYFLWRGFHTRRWWAFVLSGLVLGGSMYTYPSARFIPVGMVVFLALDALARRVAGPTQLPLWREHWRNLLLLVTVAAIVIAPLAYYFLFVNPEQFFYRISRISVFSTATAVEADPAATVWDTVTGNLAGLVWHGDEDPLYNIPGRPMFGPVMFAAFAVGVVIAVWRAWQPPYLFALVWWIVMMVPAFLVTDRIPAFKRAIGISPGIFIFPALAWVTLALWLTRRWRRPAAWGVAVVLPLLVYTATGVVTYQDYFLKWGPEHPHYQDVLTYQDLAARMRREANPDELWVFPLDARNFVRRYYRLEGFTSYPGLPPRAFIPVDTPTTAAALNEATQGFERVVLVTVESGQEAQADPNGVMPFLLEKYGTFDGLFASPDHDYRLDYYVLDSARVDMTVADLWQPVGINYGGVLHLAEVGFGDTSASQPPDARQIPSGETMWVALRWQVLAETPANFISSLRLTSPQGHVIAQADRPLINGEHRPTSSWRVGDEVVDTFLLPLEPGSAPDDYRLEVLLYQPDSGDILPPDRATTTTAGAAQIATVPVAPALVPGAAVATEQALNKPWRDTVTLLGSSNPPAVVKPGDQLELALLWGSDGAAAQTLRLNLVLTGSETDTELLLAEDVPVGSQNFPTTDWRAGEVVHQWLVGRVPANASPGEYQLLLSDPDASQTVGLGKIIVEAGRSRQFAPPQEIQQPVAVTLGDQVALLGFDINITSALQLVLYWQALAEIPEDYKVFVHVLNPQGQLVAQQDQVPLAGQAPTTGWLPKEVIADAYSITIPPENLVPGSYQLRVGLYNAVTGQRLPVTGSTDDFVLLPYSFDVGQ